MTAPPDEDHDGEWRVRSVDVAEDQVPVSVSIGLWGPSDEVFFAYDARDRMDDRNDRQHSLWLEHGRCSDQDGCAQYTSIDSVRMDGGESLTWDQKNIPSIAVGVRADGSREVSVVHRKKAEEDCDEDGVTVGEATERNDEVLSLGMWQSVYVQGAAPFERSIDDNVGTGFCRDRGQGFTRYGDGEIRSCWRIQSQLMGDNAINCGSAPALGVGGPGPWTVEGLMPLASVEDHVWFDWLPTAQNGSLERVLVHHAGDGDRHAILVRFPDDPTDTPVWFPAPEGSMKVDHPSVQRDGGVVRVLWQQEMETAGERSILLGQCDLAAPDGCTEQGWGTPENVASGRLAAFPQLVAEGEYQVVVYQAKIPVGQGEPAAGKLRVMFSERCGVSPWSEPRMVDDMSAAWQDPEMHQAIQLGTPALALNRDEGLLHIAYISSDTEAGEHTAVGGILHAVRPVPGCPLDDPL